MNRFCKSANIWDGDVQTKRVRGAIVMRSEREREREREREIQILKFLCQNTAEYHLHRHCSTAVHYQLMPVQVSFILQVHPEISGAGSGWLGTPTPLPAAGPLHCTQQYRLRTSTIYEKAARASHFHVSSRSSYHSSTSRERIEADAPGTP